ncbi:unnamed protein product [Meloidogyne enterolobii]|uniref:Uncharacterized protein n=1 Tax=Meloidogyne enterolobii TaxID=390850 RepID=A0ACB1AAJ8_MELEN
MSLARCVFGQRWGSQLNKLILMKFQVSIIPTKHFLGHTLICHKNKIFDNDYKEKMMTILLSGRASEIFFFQSPSSLTENDFDKFKQIANSLDLPNLTKEDRDKKLIEICNKCREEASNLIENNSIAIEKLSNELLKSKEIEDDALTIMLKNIYEEEMVRKMRR